MDASFGFLLDLLRSLLLHSLIIVFVERICVVPGFRNVGTSNERTPVHKDRF